MCGIAGFITTAQDDLKQRLLRMTSAMSHRGPDDEGIQIIDPPGGAGWRVGLGNRRLAILDLSAAGHQPMFDRTTGNCIVYNGEVFNFAEIRDRLSAHCEAFSSNSDTEVLLKSYGLLGVDAISEWRGMFGCAIWDHDRQRLLLIRDRLGIKPVYYYWNGKTLVFASEVRSLFASGLVPKTLNTEGVISYLAFGSVQDPLTLIEGVHALLPGHYAEWHAGNLAVHRYWELPAANTFEPETYSERDVIEQTRSILEESVRLRLISDVPLGAFLSGGIDSSAIVALMRKAQSQLKTFSLVFPDSGPYDESPYSRLVAQKFQSDHHEIPVTTKDVLSSLPKALAAMDQPSMDGVNSYVVCGAAKQAGVTVALSGLGGDEVFCGYPSFRQVPRMQRLSHRLELMPPGMRKWIGAAISQYGASDRWRKVGLLVAGNGNLPLHLYFLGRAIFTAPQLATLTPALDDSVRMAGCFNGWMNEIVGKALLYDPVTQVSCLELRTYMANTLLRDVDAMSMAHSLEVRVPLIDHKLVEHMIRLPGRLKLGADAPKRLLVRALDGALPDEIVHRKKWTFSFPFDNWFRGELKPLIETSLCEGGTALEHILSKDAVRQQWGDFLDGRTNYSRSWTIAVLQHWCASHL
jgi:asparagine synthase (glutamine-hydrolysing)